MKVSVVINNFNYGRFLPACIDSVLAQTWQDWELLVVDDGSTDDSIEVIRRYGARIVPILQPNGGQASAYRAGFEQASGDLVYFLDADDFLAPHCLERVVAAWQEDVVKVQFRLEIVDEFGKTTHGHTPSGQMTDRRAREMMDLFGAYCSPPASGNVFSRGFLQKVFPYPNEKELVFAADAPVIFAAPYFGKIVSLPENLAFYRRHAAANASGTLDTFSKTTARQRLEAERGRDELRDRTMKLLFQQLELSPPPARFREPTRAKRELCLLRLAEPGKGSLNARFRATWSGLLGALHWDGYRPAQRAMACVWFLAAGLLPWFIAGTFVKIALNLGSRPAWISRFLGGKRAAPTSENTTNPNEVSFP